MPPTISPEERRRLAVVRYCHTMGIKCTYVAPVPKKNVVPPQLAVVPRPTASVSVPTLGLPTENQIAEWASDDAKYHVYQASLNATRPINTRTTNPIPEFLPAQRKYFAGGVVQRTFKRQLSLADDATYAKYYRYFLVYWKEVQASLPPAKAYEFTNPPKTQYDNMNGTPIHVEGTTTVRLYWYIEGGKESPKFNTPENREKYKRKMEKEGKIVYKDCVDSDNAPLQAPDKDGEVVTKLAPIVYGTKQVDKWHNSAHEDLSNLKASGENVPFTVSLDANALHPVMFCDRPKNHLEATEYLVEETNKAALALRSGVQASHTKHRQNVSGGDKTEFNTITGTNRRVD